MITKFLYQMNAKNKRILTGLVENDLDEGYDSEREIPMVLEQACKLLDGERKVSNFGRLYYGVFSEGMTYRYLNINDYMLKVKVNASDKVAFASALSKEMIESILNNTNYLDCDFDFDYVDSGLRLKNDLTEDDSYIVFFKKVDDDSYVELTDGTQPEFVSVVDGNYDLVTDFKEAMRVYKKEVRNLLVTHGWVNKDIKKADVAISHFNVFTNGPQSYLFGGENSFKVTLIDNNLTIENDPELTNEYRLAADETRSQILRNILYAFKKPKSHVNKILKVNDLYISKNDKNNYSLVEVASKATAIPETEIEILKNAISLFIKEAKFYEIDNNNMINFYLYNTDNNYQVTTETREEKSRLLSQEVATNFIHAFKEYKSNGDYIVKSNNSYIKLDYTEAINSFVISYQKSAIFASRFTLEEYNTLYALLNTKLEKREITEIPGSKDYLRIKCEEPADIITQYNDFLAEKNNTNIRFSNSTELSNIKYGSDKGSYEYMESLFVKGILDSKKVFDKILPRVNNILILGSTNTLDLTALSMSASEIKRNINVTMLDTTKWGYYPKCYVSSYVSYNGAYRLHLEELTDDFISKFDAIFIGKTFKAEKEDLADFYADLAKSSFNGYIVNVKLNEEYGFDNSFEKASQSVEFKYSPIILDTKDIENSVGNSILDNTLSSYAILKVKNGKISDAIRRK